MENKTILLVEDDFLNRRLSKKILLENKCRVLEAKNAIETFEILKKETIDLLILDINLGKGEQDGISLAEQIKDKYNIPFIFLTAYENIDIINKALGTSPYSYLTKPFKKIDLIASIEVALLQSVGVSKRPPTLSVKNGEYFVELPIGQIDYIESNGNYLLIYASKNVYKYRSTIKQILELLPQNTFFQTHRAYIVNKNSIEKYTHKSIIIGDTVIPVSKHFASVFQLL